MIRPVLQNMSLLADIQEASTDYDALHVWWLGQSGFLVQWHGRHLLLDPYLSNSLTNKYATTDKPHVRMTEPPVEPGMLSFVDVVTSSHMHTDHMDAETLIPLLEKNPRLELVIPEANREQVVDRLSLPIEQPRGLVVDQSLDVAGFSIHAVPAAHEERSVDAQGRDHFLGYIIDAGPYSIYHSGDTVWFEGMSDYLRTHQIDLAMLPINGRAPERRVAGNLNGREAATLAKEIQANCVIPCHYEMFEFNTATPDEFIRTCQELDVPYQVLRCGERFSWPKL